ncbi:xylulokinase [Pasteurella oralis]|uniref:xylulokinase n=1 Tax=Pasteurella oralis TaxID=1071947 RepID=UPI000C7E2886|nr:FGGY-family carbohydrate kinase [Pasteurella oralis]
MQNEKQCIDDGRSVIGIELGSTRVKAVLIDEHGTILASGGADWENHFIDGIWTYHQTEIWHRLQQAYQDLQENVQAQYATLIKSVKAIGISAMMHGYLPFDKHGNLLVPFRTWRNNTTAPAAQALTKLFNYPIPQRWSIAHLYQAILNQESHIQDIDYLTTLSGYIHWQLTGEKVLGIGDASGMFPIDINTLNYDTEMIALFNQHIAQQLLPWQLDTILPKVRVAGQNAGNLTQQGALLLDPTGNLVANIPLCPPEGDAGTGMVATNCIKAKTGNISAGTSVFAMVVLEKALSRVYSDIDLVTTPTGKLVAMVHANNCSSDINAWVNLIGEALQAFGVKTDTQTLYQTLFLAALQGEADCGGLLSYGFYSGEHSVGLSAGCPIFLHPANAHFNLANFMRVHLYSAFGAMKLGMDILRKKERVNIEHMLAHGGIFQTKHVVLQILASALNIPLATMDTAANGGAWGIALLANFLHKSQHKSLEDYLEQAIFNQVELIRVEPDPSIVEGYQVFIRQYQKGLPIVQAALDTGVA